MAKLESVETATFTENGQTTEGLEFTWIVTGASASIARIRARMLTAKAFPLQWADELKFPPLRNIDAEKIDEGVIEPRPIGKSGLVKTWRIVLFMPTEDDTFSTPVENILERAEEILEKRTA